jgi:hypothetical protein
MGPVTMAGQPPATANAPAGHTRLLRGAVRRT